MWEKWNSGKYLEGKIINYNGKTIEYDIQEDDSYDETGEQVRNELNFHMLNLYLKNSPFNSKERIEKYKGVSYDSTGQHEGYMIDINIEDKKINEINLFINSYGWGETEDLMKDTQKNKEEIEFVKLILKDINIL